MYPDKLGSRIDTAFFDSKPAEWRAGQDCVLCDLAAHQAAYQSNNDEVAQLLQIDPDNQGIPLVRLVRWRDRQYSVHPAALRSCPFDALPQAQFRALDMLVEPISGVRFRRDPRMSV